MYLFDEHPIIANKTLAREIGLNEALILQQINYWIEINKKTGKNFFEGRYWTYNSIKSWRENDFDYMSLDTVKRTFAKLEKQGYLMSGNFNTEFLPPKTHATFFRLQSALRFRLSYRLSIRYEKR